MHSGNLEWELFDLDKDPQERNNIASMHPEIIKKVGQIVARERTTSPNQRFQFSVLGE
jgi:hypothetical protein